MEETGKKPNFYLNRAFADFDYACLCVCNFLDDIDLRSKVLKVRVELCNDFVKYLHKDSKDEKK